MKRDAFDREEDRRARRDDEAGGVGMLIAGLIVCLSILGAVVTCAIARGGR
jgi:hypothetical protein